MSEMVERVTKAILAKVPVGCGMTPAEAQAYARAAIEAMREPTDAMIGAVLKIERGMTSPVPIKGHWRAMIDAALSE